MDHLSIDRFLKVWAEILSDHYDVNIKFTVTKPEIQGRGNAAYGI